MSFTKATKTEAKARITLNGPAGSGKTYTALTIAKSLGSRVAVIDTEHGAASKYADLFDFDQVSLDEFSLDTYIKTIEQAKARGYDVLVIDSLSHAWNGKGGALETVDKMGGNKFSNGWKTVSPKMTQLTESLLSYPGHVVCSMRTKTAYEVVKNERGQAVPQKIGMAPVQREGMEYEFDVIFDLTLDGTLAVSKSRCPPLSGRTFTRPELQGVLTDLTAWLGQGRVKTDVERISDDIRAASSRDGLAALVEKMKLLPEEDRAALRPLYVQRVNEFSGEVL